MGKWAVVHTLQHLCTREGIEAVAEVIRGHSPVGVLIHQELDGVHHSFRPTRHTNAELPGRYLPVGVREVLGQLVAYGAARARRRYPSKAVANGEGADATIGFA